MDCPRSLSSEKIKNGFVRGLQRYECKECSYSYTVEKRSGEYSKATKRKALQLYLEGLGFRSIGRILGVSNVSVLNWIRDFGEKVKSLQSENKAIEYVELDEVHSYIGNKKKYCWIWIAVDRFGKRFINFFVGDRSNKSVFKF